MVNDVHNQVARIKSATPLPVVIGFGVKSPEQVQDLSQGADGVVVGSALVTAIADSLDDRGQATEATVETVLNLVSRLSQPLR